MIKAVGGNIPVRELHERTLVKCGKTCLAKGWAYLAYLGDP